MSVKKPKTKKRWKPDFLKGYWFIADNGWICCRQFDPAESYDIDRYQFYNCFRTRTAALKARNKVKKLLRGLG